MHKLKHCYVYKLILLPQALKLSDDLNLNEISCVRLLVSANTEVHFIYLFLRKVVFATYSINETKF